MRGFSASLLALVFMLGLSSRALAESSRYRGVTSDNLESLDDPTPAPNQKNTAKNRRVLATGDDDADVSHFQNQATQMGVDLGVMIPFGDYQKLFTTAPMLGLHMIWQAVEPFGLTVSMERSSMPNNSNNQNGGKLTMNAVNIGAQATLPAKRFSPFIKLEGSFQFNSVNFNDGRTIVRGDDDNLTTVGLNLGLGFDLVVGREVSVGFIVTYHYAVPKNLLISDGTTFNLGSPFVTSGLRVSF
jgi:hypothetical protein